MASSCPKCGQVIEAEFGVLNCPSCSAMLSVNFDGSVTLAEDENAEQKQETTKQDLENDFSGNESSWSNEQDLGLSNEDSLQKQELDSLDSNSDFLAEDTFSKQQTDNQEVKENDWAEKEEQNQSAPKETAFAAEESNENVFESSEEERTRVLESSGYQDVEDFGNSELSSSTSGGILYDLMIEGIDTKVMRDEIRLELKDKRYRLDSDSLLKSIHNGKLVIKGLNPAKAALLVNHLKHLDVEIQWKQNEIIRM